MEVSRKGKMKKGDRIRTCTILHVNGIRGIAGTAKKIAYVKSEIMADTMKRGSYDNGYLKSLTIQAIFKTRLVIQSSVNIIRQYAQSGLHKTFFNV